MAIICVVPAATPSFWPHWNDERGMDRQSWTHADRALHPGATNGILASIERLLPLIAQRVIELNVPATRIKGQAEPSEDYRIVDILQFILGVVKPRTVMCVGAAALRFAKDLVLPWPVAMFEARKLIDWDIEYERAFADMVNSSGSATAIRPLPPTASRSRVWVGSACHSGPGHVG